MMSYLYPEDEVTFDKSGFGPLPDMLASYAEEEANSYFELYFEYPLFSSHERGDYNQIYVNMSDYLIEGNQVTYKPSHSREPHAFRIYKTDKQVERGIILVWARTRTADLRGNPVRKVKSNGAPVSSALKALKMASEETHPFSFTTNIQSNINFEKTQTNVLDALAGEEESILAITGGQMIRTNNNIYIGINESSKNVVEFRLGKNIEGISYEVDYSNVVTAVIPFYTQTYKLVDDIRDEIVRDSSGKIVKNADGTTKYNRTVGKKRESLDNEVIVYGDTVFSQYANDYSTPFYSFVEIRDDREDVGVDKDPLPPFTKTDINNRAVDWFDWEENLGVDEPEVSVKVDVHDISQSSEYSHNVNLSKLETLNVFDKALVYVPEVGIDMDMEINYVRYDGVAEKNLEVRLGTTLTSLTETVLSPQQRAFNERVQQLDREIEKSLMSSDGKSRVYWMATKPVGQFEIGDLWFDISLDGGIYVWDGYDWVAKLPPEFGKLIEDSVNEAIEAADLAMQEARSSADKALLDAKAYAEEQDRLITQQVTQSVNTAISTADAAKVAAKTNADKALADAKAHAIAQDKLITQQVNTSVGTALSTAQAAKTAAESSYTNAVAEAERLVGVQTTAFNKKFEENTTAMGTLSQAAKDADVKAQSALTKAGTNANTLTTHQTTLNTINTTTIPAVNKAAADAMTEAKKADTKIAAYVTSKGLVSGTTVDNKINTATGEIDKKITTVEGKIPTEIGGRNYFSLTTLNKLQPTNWVVSAYVYTFKLEPNTKYTLSSNVPDQNGDSSKTNIYFNGSGTSESGVWEGKSNVSTSDENGNIFVAIPTGRPYTQDILDGKYWVQLEKGTIRTDWTAAEEDNYTQSEFSIFESTYKEDVKGINSTLTDLSTKKLDSTTYTTFYTNEYKKTAQGVTDAFTKLNKIMDANGNTLDTFAKAVYDKNATRQSAAFTEVTKNLVTTTTYTAGINGLTTRLSAIDSTDPTSVVTRLNKTESTVSTNSTLLTTIKNNYVTQTNIDTSILSDKKIKDTRSTNQLPSWYFTNYPSQEVREFKQVSTMGIGSGTYGILTTDVPWTGYSGGTVKQRFETNEGIHTRQSNSAATAWGAWVKQIDTADTSYQKITERSDLYERVIGSSSEAGVKQAMSRIVMADSTFQTEVVDRQNLLTAMASGAGMTDDPYFNKGNNGIGVYDNAGTGTITIRRTLIPSDTTIPIPKGSTGYRLDIAHAASSATTPNRGGIINSKVSWANGTVVIKFVALLPTGRSFSPANNPLGTGYTLGWLTDNKGTGKWETYMYYYRFGSTGSFSSFGHMSVTGATTAFTWYLSEYDIINVNETTASKVTQLSDSWSMKLTKADDVVTQINATSAGVVIQGKNIQLDGNVSMTSTFSVPNANIKDLAVNKITGTTAQFTALVTKGLVADVITSTMIKADAGLFDMLFSSTLATTRLAAQNAWITNAAISSLDAAKITTGTIAAARINASAVVTAGLTANVVKSTHIESGTGLIDKIFATDALITHLTSKTIFATNVKAITIDASKITSGTIAAARINAALVVSTGLVADVVKSTHIAAGTALVDKIFSATAYITQLTSKTAFISSIQAISINASKITSGTLDASKVTVTNIDASKITANKTTFVQSAWNAINSEVSIDGSGIKTQNSSGDFSRIVSGELRSFNADSSSTAILGSGRSQYFDKAGSQFILGNTLHGTEWINDGTLQVTHNRRFAIGRYADYAVSNGLFHPYIALEYPAGKTGDEPMGIVRFYKAIYLQKDIYAGNSAVSGVSKITFHNGGNIESQPNTSNMLIGASNKLIVYASGANALEIDSGYMYLRRNLSMEGNKITNQSDRRLKTNIVDTPVDSLSAISSWSFKAFDRVNNGAHDDIGVIAQDTSDIVVYDKENDIYNVDSSKQIMMNSHGIQQVNTKLDKEVAQLKEQIATLQKELALAKGA